VISLPHLQLLGLQLLDLLLLGLEAVLERAVPNILIAQL